MNLKRFFNPLSIASVALITIGTILGQVQAANEWKEDMKQITDSEDDSADE